MYSYKLDSRKVQAGSSRPALAPVLVTNRTKLTYRRKGLFTVPEEKRPIMAGRQQAWQMEHQAESSYLEPQSERVKWEWL